MRAGAARRGRGEAGRRWGAAGRGGVGPGPGEDSGRSPSWLGSRDRDGQPPAWLADYHYLGQCAALAPSPSPPKHLGSTCPASRGARSPRPVCSHYPRELCRPALVPRAEPHPHPPGPAP